MKRLFILLLVLVSVPMRTSATEAQEKLKIGVIVGLTGPVAEVGECIRNAVLLAQAGEAKNASTEFIFEDDQFQPRKASVAAAKLISIDKVQGLITFGGGTSAAAASVAEQHHVPLIAITALSDLGRDKQYVYTMYLSVASQIDQMNKFIAARNMDRVDVITTTQQALVHMRDNFLQSSTVNVGLSEDVEPGDVHLGHLALKYRKSNADAILVFLLPPQISVFAKHMRAYNYPGTFIGATPLYNPPEIKAAAGALTGAVLPAPINDAYASLTKRYEAEYGSPLISEGIYAYEIARLIMQLDRKTELGTQLRRLTSFQGLAGTYERDSFGAFGLPSELRVISEHGEVLPISLSKQEG